MTDSERIRKILGVSRAEFSRRYHIPIRTLEQWDKGAATPPVYVMELLERAVLEDMRRERRGMFTREMFEEFIKAKYPEAIFKYPEGSFEGKDIMWIPGRELQFYTCIDSYKADFDNVHSCINDGGKLKILWDF